jgi:hypothetical protein
MRRVRALSAMRARDLPPQYGARFRRPLEQAGPLRHVGSSNTRPRHAEQHRLPAARIMANALRVGDQAIEKWG